MTLARRFTLDLADCHDLQLAGGKGTSLGRLIRGGFPVPRGFVITTQAYRLAHEASSSASSPGEVPPQVAEEIRLAYQAMDGGTVAVRSSATAEDLAAASMAGQCETILDVEGEADLLDAVRRCWASLDAPHIRTYFDEHGIDRAKVAMAVVVQRLVPADVAGVLFTINPNGVGSDTMLIEASWGLGETVVGGQVQPDMLLVGRKSGRLISYEIGDKRVWLAPGTGKEQPVEGSLRKKACLSEHDVHRLWELGTRIAEHLGAPQDVEWAIHAGDLHLLQSRPITTYQEIEAGEVVLKATRQHLRDELKAQRGPWVLHNLAETLPHPTPLTWSVIRQFMSGRGGFGAMYRQAGYMPAPVIDQHGFLELIAGRIYMDAARAPQLFCENFPFAYDLEILKADPGASQKPPTLPRGSLAARTKAAAQMSRVSTRLKQLASSLAEEFQSQTAPAIADYVRRAKPVELGPLSATELIALWNERETQVMGVFGPATMLPGMVCGWAWADLEAFLQENFWDEDAEGLVQLVSAGGEPDLTVIADSHLHEVATGKRSVETWLGQHGHRGPGEFDLAVPRWREQPALLLEMSARLSASEPPMERYRRGAEAARRKAAELRSRLSVADARDFDERLELVHRYMPFRENGKDLLMLGYSLLRDLALEAGTRLNIGDGVFCLTREELFEALRAKSAPHQLIEQRRLTHRAETRLSLPRVIDAEYIERFGEAEKTSAAAAGYKALPISAGQASGPARVTLSATDAGELGRGYVLVCPSTDPSWTPLFVNAAGLVLERGGALSHGAVVAREMGLPAVVLPEATRLFQEGELIHVNAIKGRVMRALHAADSNPAMEVSNPEDTRIPFELMPPPPGRRDRRAARLCLAAAALWMIYLAGFFLLPKAYVYQPSLAVLDALLWPLVRQFGKPAVVGIVAAGLGILMVLAQKLTVDNRRLREAKRRAALLTKESQVLPEDSPRRKAFTKTAATVDFRVLTAALVPVGLLLGLLVASFAWLTDRMDPSVTRGLAGSPVQIVASVNSDWSLPVQIQVPAPLAVDETTPALRTLPPVRKTLEHLLALARQPQTTTDTPWELQRVPELGREQTVSDLQSYLAAGIPSQGITWMVRSPSGTAGRFKVEIATEGHPPLAVNVVLGEDFPPGQLSAVGRPSSPVEAVRVVYPPSGKKPVFWQPLSGLAGRDTAFAERLAALNVGWLWLYIIAYLPALFLSKAALKVP